MPSFGIRRTPPANATGYGVAIATPINQLPLTHQDAVVVRLLAGVTNPYFLGGVT